MRITTSTNKIILSAMVITISALLTGFGAGQWWLELGLGDSERWSHLSGAMSVDEIANLRQSAVLIGSMVGTTCATAVSSILFLAIRQRNLVSPES